MLEIQYTVKSNKMAEERLQEVIPNEVIMKQIVLLRGQKVILDKDLATLYQVTTGNLNKAVSRNIKRFPSDFMFQLTTEELKNLIFQFGISSWGGTRKLPHAFTEQGVAMLSGILNSDRAISVNIQIMRVFADVRKMLLDNTELRLAIEEIRRKTDNHSKNIELVFKYLDELLEKKANPVSRELIGFKPGETESGSI